MNLTLLRVLLRRTALLLGLGGLAASCTFTATGEVEPALPSAPVYNSNTVVYKLNGLPVVAHNASSVLASVFGGNQFPPVDIHFEADSSLVFESADEQNERQPGRTLHALEWKLPRFRGVGSYRPAPAGTSFQLSTYNADRYPEAGPLLSLDPALPAEIVVTAWDAATQHVHGTFVLHFAAQNGAPAAALSEGAFDMKPSH